MTASLTVPDSARGVIWGLTDGHRWTIAVLASFTFVGALIEAGFLVLLTATLLAVAGATSTIGPVAGTELSVPSALMIAAAAIIGRLLCNIVAVRLSARLTSEVTRDRREALAAGYLRTSWAQQQQEPSGRLQELLTSFVSRVTTGVLSITQAITAVLSLLAFIGTGVFMQPLATGVMLLALLTLGLALTPVRRAIRRRAGAWSHMNLRFANKVSELASLGQEMQTFGVRPQFLREIANLTKENAEQQRLVQALNGFLSPLYTFLAYVAILGGLWALKDLAAGDVASIGAVMLLLLRSLSYGQQLLTVSGQLATAAPFLRRLEVALEGYQASPAPSGSSVPESIVPIVVRDVEFSYGGDRSPALLDASFSVDSIQTVGVIGPSGSGKSTLAQLLLGLREPERGRISVGGVSLRDVDRTWWSTSVAFVPQEPRLITGTVAENIRFFREKISVQHLERAAADANILDDIKKLPGGFDAHLGERGATLSGGQRQRLSIARALAGQPLLLILDEPTSALDGHSELLVRDALANLRGAVTMFIIAHRMSTLELCDRIMVVEQGRITADAAPGELRQHSDFYRRALAVAGID